MNELTAMQHTLTFSLRTDGNGLVVLDIANGNTVSVQDGKVLANTIDAEIVIQHINNIQMTIAQWRDTGRKLLFPKKSKEIEITEQYPGSFEVRTPTGQAFYTEDTFQSSIGYHYMEVIDAISNVYDEIMLLNEHGTTASTIIHNSTYNLLIMQSAGFQVVASWHHLISNLLRGVLVNGIPMEAVCIYPCKHTGRIYITDLKYNVLGELPYDSSAILCFKQIPNFKDDIDFKR